MTTGGCTVTGSTLWLLFELTAFAPPASISTTSLLLLLLLLLLPTVSLFCIIGGGGGGGGGRCCCSTTGPSSALVRLPTSSSLPWRERERLVTTILELQSMQRFCCDRRCRCGEKRRGEERRENDAFITEISALRHRRRQIESLSP